MSRDTETQLKKQISTQEKAISSQQKAINSVNAQILRLLDRLTVIERDMDTFKTRVGEDFTKVANFLKEEKKNEANRY